MPSESPLHETFVPVKVPDNGEGSTKVTESVVEHPELLSVTDKT